MKSQFSCISLIGNSELLPPAEWLNIISGTNHGSEKKMSWGDINHCSTPFDRGAINGF
jgi:hypothetical protein